MGGLTLGMNVNSIGGKLILKNKIKCLIFFVVLLVMATPRIATVASQSYPDYHDYKITRNNWGATSAYAFTSWPGVLHRTECWINGPTASDTGVGYTQTATVNGWGVVHTRYKRL